MAVYQKVVWPEGMFLTPHHFQQMDHYHENLLNFRMNSVLPFGCGLLSLEIDHALLKTGVFRINLCEGVMPDGFAIRISGADEAPKSRDFKALYAQIVGDFAAYLAIPVEHVNGMNCALEENGKNAETRYFGRFAQVYDENTGNGSREMMKARANLKILFSGERLDNHCVLKIAELSRASSNAFKLKRDFIPPCMAISASNTLSQLIRNINGSLKAKSEFLSKQGRQSSATGLDFGATNVTLFWFLHTINSFIPSLEHINKNADCIHPERLYCLLSQLAGALSTFAVDEKPEVEKYNHDNLYVTFDALDEKIRKLLEAVLPTQFSLIPLEETQDAWHVGRVKDEALFDTAGFYLAARADLKTKDLITQVGSKIKIGSEDTIAVLVNQALPGVELTHVDMPPAALPVRLGYQYYLLESHGRIWQKIRAAKNFAIYVPDEFPGLDIELYAVKES